MSAKGAKAPELSFCLFWHFTIKEVNMQNIITILLLSNAVSFVAILVLLKKIERLKKAK